MKTNDILDCYDLDRDKLFGWRKRGKIPSAPKGKHGAGRGNQLNWSPQAIAEIEAILNA